MTKKLSRQAYFCHNKRLVLSRQMCLHVCCDKTFVTTKIILGAAPTSDTEKVSSMSNEQHLPLQWAGPGTARGPSGGSGLSSAPLATWPPGGSTTHSAPPAPHWRQVLTQLCSCPPLKFDQQQPVALKHALRCGTAAGTWTHNWLYQGCWCKQNNTNTNNCLHYM